MAVDRESLKKSFESYVSSFDREDERVALKIVHTYRVAENSDYIADALGLDDERKDIAWAIAMLHDIGRFEQVSKRRSFIDSADSDHALEGVRYLFGRGRISDFLPEGSCAPEALRCIELAVKYHNRYRLPEGLGREETLFCSIIRDADKLDIFRISLMNSFEAVHEFPREEVSASRISPAVVECFERRETLDYSKRQYPADIFLGHIAMCFGLFYPCSRELAARQGWVEKMMDFRFAGEAEQKQYEQMKEQVREFLREE